MIWLSWGGCRPKIPVTSNHAFTIPENIPTNTVIGKIHAGNDGYFTNQEGIASYTIIDESVSNITNTFAISTNGTLTTIKALSYMVQSNYDLVVEILNTDNEYTQALVTVMLTSIPIISNHFFLAPCNVPTNMEIGRVEASDARGIVSYTIVAGNTDNRFAISDEGILTSAKTIYGPELQTNYNLTVEVSNLDNNSSNSIVKVDLIEVLWMYRYMTNYMTNTVTLSDTGKVVAPTAIDAYKSDMFVWLDVSQDFLIQTDTNSKLSNWLDKSTFGVVGTNTNSIYPPITNVTIELISGSCIGLSNVIVNAITTLSPITDTSLYAEPESDISSNRPYVSKSSGDQYVRMRYQGGDRAGIAIDTSGMNDSHSVKAFYIVTDFSSRNNRRHVVLGYDDLSSNKRFISKKNLLNSYSPSGEDGVSNIVLGDSTFKRYEDFTVPSGLHLISRRELDISKSQLNGILGTFPTSGEEGGEQYIREIIIFTNDISDAQHRNIVNYFLSKWNIDREPLTNIYSYYNHANNHILENGADGRVSTYFQAAGSIQKNIESNRVLFEAIYAPSVLNTSSDAYSSLVQGVSKGKESLMLKSGCNLHSDGIRVPFRVEILRTNDNRWFVLSNVPANSNSGFKQFLFFLESFTK